MKVYLLELSYQFFMDIYSSSCIFLLFSVIIQVFILVFFLFVIHSSISISLFKFEHKHWTYEQSYYIFINILQISISHCCYPFLQNWNSALMLKKRGVLNCSIENSKMSPKFCSSHCLRDVVTFMTKYADLM